MSENNKEVIYFFVILSLSKDLLFNSILPVKKILHYVQNDSPKEKYFKLMTLNLSGGVAAR